MPRRKFSLSDLIVVLVLGLGLSACIVFWTVYSPYYFDPSPGLDGGRIVSLSRHGRTAGERTPFAAAELDELRAASEVFSAVGVFGRGRPAVVQTEDQEFANGSQIDAGFLRVFGCRASEGALFGEAPSPGDLLLSAEFRASFFAGRASVVGETVLVNGEKRTVVGVLAPVDWPRVVFPVKPEFFLPPARPTDPDQPNYNLMARLQDGVAPAQARAVLSRVNDEVEVAFVKDGLVTEVQTIDDLVRAEAAWFPLLFGGGLFLLLGVSLNLAMLMVGRVLNTLDDWAVRRALGATQWHLQWHLARSFFPLALLGGLCGLVLSRAMVAVVLGIGAPDGFPLDRWRVGLDLIPVVFGLAVVATLICLLPAFLVIRKADLAPLMLNRRAGGVGKGGFGKLAFVQLAMGVALAVTSTAVILHYWQKRSLDLGFDPNGLSVGWLESAPDRDPRSLEADFEALRERLQTDPAIVDVAGSDDPPFVLYKSAGGKFTPGPSFDNPRFLEFRQSRVTPNYFSVLRMGLRGEGFQKEGRQPGDVVVSKALAETFWGDNGLHAMFQFGRSRYRIVGVAENRAADDLSGAALPTVYYPLDLAATEGRLYLVVRSTRSEAELKRQLEAILPDLPSRPVLVSVRSVEGLLAGVLQAPRFLSTVLLYLSLLVLATAAIGLVGTCTRQMSQRRREIAVRQALGATTGRIVLQVGLRVGRFAAPAILAGVMAGGWLVSSSHEVLGVDNPGYVPIFAIAAGVGVLISLVVLSPIVRVTRQDLSSLLRF